MSPRSLSVALLATVALLVPAELSADPPQMPAEGVAKQLERRGGGRVPFSPDAIALAMARGELSLPEAIRAGRIEVEGDGTLAKALREA